MFGKFPGNFCTGINLTNQMIKKIKVSQHFSDSKGDYRDITFYQPNGRVPPAWRNPNDNMLIESVIRIYNPTMLPSKPGKELDIPDDHAIVGCAVELDSQGAITWIDFKTCPDPDSPGAIKFMKLKTLPE